MIIALAAYRFINNDIVFNKTQIKKAMKAAQGKANLLCFGETFLQGFDALTWNYKQDKTIGICQDDAIIQELGDMTEQFGVDLLFGYIEKEDDKLYSSCMLIENGQILHNYRRISIGWKDYKRTDEHYCEGTSSGDIFYKGKKIQIALCGDLWEYPDRFKTDGLLLWPVYVNFNTETWKKYEQEYAQQAGLVAKKALLVNSISDTPKAIGGAFYYENGLIAKRLSYHLEDILFVKV